MPAGIRLAFCSGFLNFDITGNGFRCDSAGAVAAGMAVFRRGGGKVGNEITADRLQIQGKAGVFGQNQNQVAGYGVHFDIFRILRQNGGAACRHRIEIQLLECSFNRTLPETVSAEKLFAEHPMIWQVPDTFTSSISFICISSTIISAETELISSSEQIHSLGTVTVRSFARAT